MDRNIIRQNREALKKFFKKGSVPTEEQFAQLIDSMANIVEDGQLDIISLFTEESKDNGTKPAWTISVMKDKRLVISNEDEEAVVEISQDKTVTMHGNDKPKPVRGDGYLMIPADKKWYDMPVNFSQGDSNCHVFSIYASYNDNMEYCRLTRATAMWMNKMEQQIESPQKHWWGWSGCVKMRWDGSSKLQIRTKKRFGGEVQCRIVEMYKA